MKNLLQLMPKVRAGIFCMIMLHMLQPRAMAQGDQTAIKAGNFNAWLHLPDDYNSTTETYPLLLFFHGVGEGGSLNAVLTHGLPKLIARGAKMEYTVGGKLFKFIVVSPQVSTGGWMNADNLDGVLESIKKNYRVDLSRIYITGLSAGGYATWNYPAAKPEYAKKIAAIAPVSAAGVDYENTLCNIATYDVKLRTYCGSNDQFYYLVDKYLTQINACNPPVKATSVITAGAGHTGSYWDQAFATDNRYNTPNMYEWMLQYRRTDVGVPGNTLPTANAGSDVTITLPTASVSLDGSASRDADGTIATYSWTKKSGPAVGTITPANAAKTSITGLTTAGTYVYTLTVTDNAGGTASDDVTIIVRSSANTAPVANAGTAQTITLPTNTVSLDGSASTDAEGTITYAWTKVSGGTAAISTANAAKTNVTGLAAGTYVFQLTVTDAGGLTNSSTVTVTVNAAPAAPVAKVAASAISITLPTTTATLDGSVSTGTITSYAWTKVSGPTGGTISTSSASKTTVSGLQAGAYVYKLAVTSAAGTSEATVTVNVTAAATSGDCASCKLTVTPNAEGGVWMDLSGKGLQPGDTICIKAGKYTYIEFFNATGSAEKPLVFINCGGIVESGDGGDRGFSFRNVKYFKFTGTGTGDKYGFKANGASKYIPSGFSAGKGCTDYEVEHLEITKAEAGILCKINPDCDPETWYPNFAIRNLKFHDIYIHDVLGEGMYIGHTSQNGVTMTCNGATITQPPPRIYNCKVYNVTTDGTGWDGIQVSTVPEGLEIYNNKVLNYGLENKGSQQAGIIFGGEGIGSIHDNLVSKGTGNGIQVFGSTHIDVYNNVVNEAGYDGTSEGQDAIFIDDKPTKLLYKPIQVYVFNNTVVKSKRNGIMFFNSQGTVAAGNLFYNNLIVAPGSLATKGTRAYLEVDRSIDFKEANNYFEADINNVKFVNPAGNDFHLQASSPAIDKGQDLSAYGIKRDFDGEARPYGAAYDAGADEYTGATPTNKTPTANAGTDITVTLPTNTASLDGSGSTDADGNIATWAWVKKSGPTAGGGAITTAGASKTTVTGLVEGTYVFTLTVTDDKGATHSDDVTVTVKAAAVNVAPVAKAGADVTITLPTNSVSLDGSTSTDSDGTITKWAWTKKSGPTAGGGTITTAAASKTTVTGLLEGTYTFTLTVTDDKGATHSDDVTVTVKAAAVNVAPVAKAGADVTITLPTNSVSLDGSTSTDSDGTITKWAWTKKSGPTAGGGTITTAAASKTTVTGLLEGTYIFTLTVTDDKGATHSDDVVITVKAAANVAPVAKAGADVSVSLPTNTVALDGGSSTDSDGTIAKWAWTKQSGPTGGAIASPAAAKTNITSLIEGTYVYRLTVTDDKGLTHFDDVTITVKPAAANDAPTANAGADITITLPTSSAALDASGSTDTDGTIAKYVWTKVSGPAGGAISNAAVAKTTVTGLLEGTYVYAVTVTDNNGATATDEVTIVVKAAIANVKPVANAGSTQTITLPTSAVSLDGSASSDADGSIASYQWKKTSGPAGGAIANTSSARTNVTGLTEGTYVFTLTVTDDGGLTSTADVTVVVSPAPNRPPVVYAGADITITLPTNSTTLDASLSYDPDGAIVNYSWKKTSGPSGFAFANGSSAKTLVTNLVAGTYVFTVTATDDKGLTAFDDIIVTVQAINNAAPIANAGPDVSITLPASETQLNGSGSLDTDGTIASYKWVQVYGPAASIANSNVANTSVSGLAQGEYIFELTVVDNNGATASDRITILVLAEPNGKPVANAGGDRTVTLPFTALELDGTGSYDTDGTITGYSWKKISGPAEGEIVGSNAAGPNLVGLVAGVYEFELTVTDNKFETATDVVRITVKAPEDEPVQINMYPNPARDNLRVELKNKELKNVTVVIYNSFGQVVKMIRVGNTNGGWHNNIQITDLASGVYVLKVDADGVKYAKMFIKAGH
ncbi:PKD domain-containing protein [Chitinophaga horti]|uniref:PKD domain-containing protein n=1 Tax=Chitinophaga horti TaxID=2920382 RepID=A0ABY6J604_9BACT|nr:PKD domain-containing protein [Chitinophaga horti]UYQ95115.1 PKD domain-containing protein [Chitinophaga horti]